MGNDVVIQAPPAIGHLRAVPAGLDPTPEDIIQMQQAEIRQLRLEKRELGKTTSLISGFALCALRMVIDSGLASEADEVTVPKWLMDRMQNGASIEMRHGTNGELIARLVDVTRHRLTVA